MDLNTPTQPTAAASNTTPAAVPATVPATSTTPQPAATPTAKPTRIEILLPTNAYFMSGVRDFTMAFIKNSTQFSEQWAYRFQSIVDELCNNAIEHGSAAGKDIRLTLTYYPGEAFEVIVQDTGTGISKLKAGDIKSTVEQRRKPGYVHAGIRGRGLSNIVYGWTDEVSVEDNPNGGVTIRARKKLENTSSTEISATSSPQQKQSNRLILTT